MTPNNRNDDNDDNPYNRTQGESRQGPVIESAEERYIVIEDEDGTTHVVGVTKEVVILDPVTGGRLFRRVKKVQRTSDGRPLYDALEPVYNCTHPECGRRKLSRHSVTWCANCQKINCLEHSFYLQNEVGEQESYCQNCFKRLRVRRFITWLLSTKPPQ